MPSASKSETGLNVSRTAALSTTVTNVNTSGGRVYGYHIENPNDLKAYVQMFNALAANVTLGTTVPAISLCVPAGGVLDTYFDVPIGSFTTALSVASTTTAGGAVANSTGLLTHVYYL